VTGSEDIDLSRGFIFEGDARERAASPNRASVEKSPNPREAKVRDAARADFLWSLRKNECDHPAGSVTFFGARCMASAYFRPAMGRGVIHLAFLPAATDSRMASVAATGSFAS